MIVGWLVGAAVLFLAEIVSMAFYALFAAVGALAASAVALAGGPVALQVAAFVVVSLGGMLGARRPLMRAMNIGRFRSRASGVQGMVGESAVVVQPIVDANHPGTVRLRGEDWPAITDGEMTLAPGAEVLVEEIRRAKLVVGASPDTRLRSGISDAPHFELPDAGVSGSAPPSGPGPSTPGSAVPDPLDPPTDDRPEDEK